MARCIPDSGKRSFSESTRGKNNPKYTLSKTNRTSHLKNDDWNVFGTKAFFQVRTVRCRKGKPWSEHVFFDSIVGLGAISTLPRMTHHELKLVQTCQSSKSSCFKHILYTCMYMSTNMHIFVFFVSGFEYKKDFKFTGCFPWFPSSGLSWKCKPSRPQSNL